MPKLARKRNKANKSTTKKSVKTARSTVPVDQPEKPLVLRGWKIRISSLFEARGIPHSTIDEAFKAIASLSPTMRASFDADVNTWYKKCAGKVDVVEDERRMNWALTYLRSHTLLDFIECGGAGLIQNASETLDHIEAVIQRKYGKYIGIKNGVPYVVDNETYDPISMITWSDVEGYSQEYDLVEQEDGLDEFYGFAFSSMLRLLTGHFGKILANLTDSQINELSVEFASYVARQGNDSNANQQIAIEILYGRHTGTMFDLNMGFLKRIFRHVTKMSGKYLKMSEDKHKNMKIKKTDLRRILFELGPNVFGAYTTRKLIRRNMIENLMDQLPEGETFIMDADYASLEDTRETFAGRGAPALHEYENVILNFNTMLPSGGEKWSDFYLLIARVCESTYVFEEEEYHPLVIVVWDMAQSEPFTGDSTLYCSGYGQFAVNSSLFVFTFNDGALEYYEGAIEVLSNTFYQDILGGQRKYFYEIVEAINDARQGYTCYDLDFIQPVLDGDDVLTFSYVSKKSTTKIDTDQQSVKLDFAKVVKPKEHNVVDQDVKIINLLNEIVGMEDKDVISQISLSKLPTSVRMDLMKKFREGILFDSLDELISENQEGESEEEHSKTEPEEEEESEPEEEEEELESTDEE